MPVNNTPICPTCRTPHFPLITCEDGVKAAFLEFVQRCGKPDTCAECYMDHFLLLDLNRSLVRVNLDASFHRCGATQGSQELEPFAERVKLILRRCGKVSSCGGCRASIWWMVHEATGARTPYTIAAVNHFKDCPDRKAFHPPKPKHVRQGFRRRA